MKENKKLLLIELWLGKIPDYYKFHFETMQYQNENIEIYFFTDQEVDLQVKSNNYHIIKTNINDIKNRFFLSNDRELKLLGGNIKITDLKFSYFVNMFSDIIDYNKYDYFGIYDIDTLFGDIYKWVSPFLNKKKFISLGGGKYHDRLSGPLILFKNDEEILDKFKTEKYYQIFESNEIYGYGEKDLDIYAKSINSVEIIQYSQNVEHETSKVLYDSIWSGGCIICNGNEILCSHSYDKKNTKFEKVGNTIITSHKKNLKEDFYWVTYFTESYEPMIEGLVDSIKKYSNRKCIFYTLNYDSNLRFKLDEQFIFRRIDIEKGDLDRQGRDNSVISSKPKILSDSIDFRPKGKFIYIDTDIYLTNVCDNLSKYFEILENYPLFNSHIHDKLFANDISENGEWVSTIDILSDATGIPVIIFPRRKTNLIIYDNRSQWFFDEQMSVYYQYKNTRPGIFRLHDEDSANILLSKYDFKKSLPLIDMEESDKIDMNKFESYSYHISNISQNVVLPKSENELYVFHGFKNPKFYEKICENYGKTILDIQDLIIKYENNTITFTKNNFLSDKIMKSIVRFNLFDDKMNLICTLRHQEIFKYWMFFISDIDLKNKILNIEISEEDSNRIIYKNTIKT